MTFTIRTRGAPGLLMAEYTCPEHGIFEALVQREANGDAPDEQLCPVSVDCGADCYEDCPDCGTCDESSPFTISAPAIESEALKVRAVSRGGDMAARPKGMLDTRGLAEGMKMSEWKKIQREDTRRRRHKQMVDKGLISKKVVVG